FLPNGGQCRSAWYLAWRGGGVSEWSADRFVWLFHKEKLMQAMTRRQLLRTAGAGAAALGLSSLVLAEDNAPAYTLPELPIDFDAIEPYIDAMPMEIYHDRHHRAYVDNLNKALAGHPELAKQPIDDLMRHLQNVPQAIRGQVQNNGGGHANHTMFWEI